MNSWDPHVPNKNTDLQSKPDVNRLNSGIHRWIWVYIAIPIFILSLGSCLVQAEESLNPSFSKVNQRKLIILSIDGFPGYYLDSPRVMEKIPNLSRLFSKSMGGRVKTVNPSLTYPSHTSMITGVDPGVHGIEGNRPIDPLGVEKGAWLWFTESRKVKSLVEFSKEAGLITGSVYWPVSVGEFTDWNIPQIWRTQTEEDEKFLRALSTPDLYDEMIQLTGEIVSETSDDRSKIRTGIRLFLSKQPDLTLIYSTDLDTNHHKYGVHSNVAMKTLEKVDSYVGDLIRETNLYSREDLGLIVVSDHGFHTANLICRPNRILVDMGYIRPKKNSWDFYFQSSAGMAVLVGNPKTRKGRRRFPKMPILKKRLESICPTVRMDLSGEIFQDRKKSSHPRMQALLTPERGTYISANSTGDYYEPDKGLHVHGYPNEWEDMDTILYFYGKNREKIPSFRSLESVSSVKDTIRIACRWLDIRCKYGEKGN